MAQVQIATPVPSSGPSRRRANYGPYLYLLPVIFSVIVFTIFPALYTLYLSFTNYSLAHFQDFEVVGLKNYEEIISGGSAFLPVLTWTIIWTVLTSVLNIASGLGLALLMNNSRIPERNFYRSLLVIPWALPLILSTQVWRGMFNSNGPFNIIVKGTGGDPIQFLNNENWSRFIVLLVNVWLSYPFFMTIILAALTSIPSDLYEAADIDGASKWQRFSKITFPFLLSAITPLIITQIAFQFNNFGVIYLVTNGDPISFIGSDYGKTDIIASYAYKLVNSKGANYALAAAYGMITFIVIGIITVINARVTNAFKEVD